MENRYVRIVSRWSKTASLNALLILVLFGAIAWSYTGNGTAPESLQGQEVPLPENLDDFVKDREAAIRLGKSLFWDMQLGSDGVQTCASCHFNGGADNRIKNTLRPAGKDDPDPIFSFGGPNYTLQQGDFPFGRKADEVVGGQGVYHTLFLGTTPGASEDSLQLLYDPIFNVEGINTRQVAFRNVPTHINAIFNFRNLWDGRVNNRFNGRSPFGPRDPNARVWFRDGSQLWAEPISLENGSMASVAVGPPVDVVEISANGRTWPYIGKRLLPVRVLKNQQVDPTDSHLGDYRRYDGGLNLTYQEMVEAAYHSHLWGDYIVRSEDLFGQHYEFTQTEENFSLFAGLSIMLYVSTQVSDQTPYDAYANGDEYALTQKEKDGLDVFLNKGRCIDCHFGPDFTSAGLVLQEAAEDDALVNTFRRRDGKVVVTDRGFFNIGIRPADEDHGLGRDDDFGNDLSFAEQYVEDYRLDPFDVDESTFDEPLYGGTPPVAVEGAIKTPGLRNIELTAPYMRNGSMATLRQVVDYFDRGGEFVDENLGELHPSVLPLYLSDYEKDALVSFLLTLTDERVRKHAAPFDHPQIFVPNGHRGDEHWVQDDGTGRAVTEMMEVPAVGRYGYSHLPAVLTQFQQQLGLTHFDGSDAYSGGGGSGGGNGGGYGDPEALCYMVADNDAEYGQSEDVLTKLPNGAYGSDVVVGATGTTHIEAIAFNPWTRQLLATDGGTLGSIDLYSGAFSAIGDAGRGWGLDEYGQPRERGLSDIDGLAFDPAAGGYGLVLYGVVRKVGEADLLITIDAETGKVVRNAFGYEQDYVTIRGVDYLEDIDDIAVSPWDGTLYAVNNRDGMGSRLVTLDRHTGVASDVLELPLGNVEGLGFFGDGTLYATSGEGDETIVVIDTYSNKATVQASLGAGGRDYEAVDCLTNEPNKTRVMVFDDVNGDGTMQEWEAGLAGLPVEFFRDVDGDGSITGADRLVFTGATDLTGAANFNPASTGEFLYRVVEADGRRMEASVSFDGFGRAKADQYVGVHAGLATSNEALGEQPDDFELHGNYPNPFNPSTTIAFDLAETSEVRVAVFDLLGRHVSTLVDGTMRAGSHQVRFEAGDLPSGSYLVRMSTPGGAFTRSMTLLK